MTIDADDAGLLAAINTGIAESSAPVPAPQEPTNDSGADTHDPVETPETVADANDATGADAASANTGDAVDDADKQAAGEGAAAGGESGGEAAAADGAGGEAPGEDTAADPDKTPDPLNDPLPNALKPATKERIRTLVGMVKSSSAERDVAVSQRNEVLDLIVQTRATPEQYGQALDYLRMVNGSREEREAALQFMVGEVAALAKMLGKPVPGVNMLEGHQDLIEDVGAGRMSLDRAQELAAARHQRDFTARSTQRDQQSAQSHAQRTQEITAGKNALNAVEQELRSDPHYAAKRPILIETLKPVFATIPPSRWADTFRRAYKALPAPAAARPAPSGVKPAAAPAAGAGNTPLRANNGAGAPVAAPKNLEEAIMAGVSQAR